MADKKEVPEKLDKPPLNMTFMQQRRYLERLRGKKVNQPPQI